MEARIFRFKVEIPGDLESYKTYPVYDEFGKLVGGFTVFKGSMMAGFIAGVGYPLALVISTGEPFYFTACEDSTGRISYGKVTDYEMNSDSKKVSGASEEDIVE
jgi:hypothetical protein